MYLGRVTQWEDLLPADVKRHVQPAGADSRRLRLTIDSPVVAAAWACFYAIIVVTLGAVGAPGRSTDPEWLSKLAGPLSPFWK